MRQLSLRSIGGHNYRDGGRRLDKGLKQMDRCQPFVARFQRTIQLRNDFERSRKAHFDLPILELAEAPSGLLTLSDHAASALRIHFVKTLRRS
jgi:hypothetical protein